MALKLFTYRTLTWFRLKSPFPFPRARQLWAKHTAHKYWGDMCRLLSLGALLCWIWFVCQHNLLRFNMSPRQNPWTKNRICDPEAWQKCHGYTNCFSFFDNRRLRCDRAEPCASTSFLFARGRQSGWKLDIRFEQYLSPVRDFCQRNGFALRISVSFIPLVLVFKVWFLSLTYDAN